MSTKKEKCCENCWKYNGDPDGNVGGFYVCSDPLCPCHQSESIEWEKTLDDFIKKWIPNHYGHLCDTDENDGQRLREVISQAITTAVAKRDAEIDDIVANAEDCARHNGRKEGEEYERRRILGLPCMEEEEEGVFVDERNNLRRELKEEINL